MKLLSLLAAGSLAAIAVAAPATAQVRHVTTVNRVHGPLKILPHHKHKICRTTIRRGVRDRKCHYN